MKFKPNHNICSKLSKIPETFAKRPCDDQYGTPGLIKISLAPPSEALTFQRVVFHLLPTLPTHTKYLGKAAVNKQQEGKGGRIETSQYCFVVSRRLLGPPGQKWRPVDTSCILLPRSPRRRRGTSSQILSILFFAQSSSTIASGCQQEAQSRESAEMMKWLGSLYCQESVQGKKKKTVN